MTVDISVLKQLYESGHSLQGVCNQVGLSPQRVWQRLKKNQIKVRTSEEARENRKLKLPAKQIIEMYDQGLSINDIAAEFDCSYTTIYKYLCASGKKRRSTSESVALSKGSLLNASTCKLILKLRFELGLTYPQIANRTGINEYIIGDFCRKSKTIMN